MRPTLAVIDIDTFSGQDELAREQLPENLETFRKPAVTPLWLNWLRERADLRVVCLVHDLEQLDDFLVDAIRSAPGVRGTSARLAFDGMVRGESLMDLSLLDSGLDRRAAAAVMIQDAARARPRGILCTEGSAPVGVHVDGGRARGVGAPPGQRVSRVGGREKRAGLVLRRRRDRDRGPAVGVLQHLHSFCSAPNSAGLGRIALLRNRVGRLHRSRDPSRRSGDDDLCAQPGWTAS